MGDSPARLPLPGERVRGAVGARNVAVPRFWSSFRRPVAPVNYVIVCNGRQPRSSRRTVRPSASRGGFVGVGVETP
jgi:hypothetical protein